MQKIEKKHERRSTYCTCRYALMACTLISAGCAQHISAPPMMKLQGSSLYVEPDHGIGKADLMDVTEYVLAEMYFAIEKADIESGLIRTRPLPGAQFFEFWRSDNIGADNALEANLHTLRRTVTLDISQKDEQLQIDCEVQTQRLSLPNRQISSSARIYGMFSRSSPLLQRLILNPEQEKEMAWIDLGRDSRLETEILKRIETRIVRRTSQ
jgi:hypothetical protein